jgi:predicted aspartyl protease
MPTLSDTISNLYKVGPVFDVSVTIPLYQSQILIASGSAVPSPVQISAMIDTGADCSVVIPTIMQQLGASPHDRVPVNTATACNVLCPLYSARIVFSNGRALETDELVEAPLYDQRIQCLIGRDILQECLFIYNGQNEIVTLSF